MKKIVFFLTLWCLSLCIKAQTQIQFGYMGSDTTRPTTSGLLRLVRHPIKKAVILDKNPANDLILLTYPIANEIPYSLVPTTGTTGTFLKKTSGSSAWTALTKSDVGLASVDNTPDTGKPISTAQQTALDLKANKSINLTAGFGIGTIGDLSTSRTIAADSSQLRTVANSLTKAQVQTQLNLKAPVNNPVLSGNTTIGEQVFARNIQGGDLAGEVFGKEYNYAFIEKMRTGGTPVAVCAGDSKTAGDGITDPNYYFHNLYKKFIAQLYPMVTVYNDAVSGTNTKQWRTTYLAAQIARNPDLMIINYGFNDGSNNRTDFESDYDAALTTIRASRSVNQTTIVLVTPISGNDTPNGRDSTWFKQINPIIRKLARKHLCVYVDAYGSFIDSKNGGAWYDDPYGDGRHIHQKEQINLQVASLVMSAVLPREVGFMMGSTTFENVLSTYRTVANSDATTTFPKGMSLNRASSGLPYNGQTITFRQSDGVWLQFNNSYTANGLAWRTGGSSNWFDWQYPVVANSSGNVGIGTTTQTEKLHIKDTSPVIKIEGNTSSAYITNATSSAFAIAVNRHPNTGSFNDTTKTAAQIAMPYSTTGSQIYMYTSNTPKATPTLRMTVNELGNVRFGSSAPSNSYKLEVDGSVYFGGDITARNTNALLRLENSASSPAFFASTASALSIATNRNPNSGSFADATKAAAQFAMTYNSSGSQFLFYTTSTVNSTPTLRMTIDELGGVKLGTGTADPSAILDISSTTKAFYPPRMTSAQRDAISSPQAGATVYCSDCTATDTSTGVMQTYNGSTWKSHW